MTGKHLTVAVIGAGEMANRVHYPSLASFDDVGIAGICDLDEARLRTTAQRWSVRKTFTDYRQMIDSTQPDAVYAIGQPHLMFDIWMWCLEHGCNLYIEKPMGLTMHQAEALAYLAEERGAITQVGHQRRSSPVLQIAHRRCLERGPIVHAVAWDQWPATAAVSRPRYCRSADHRAPVGCLGRWRDRTPDHRRCRSNDPVLARPARLAGDAGCQAFATRCQLEAAIQPVPVPRVRESGCRLSRLRWLVRRCAGCGQNPAAPTAARHARDRLRATVPHHFRSTPQARSPHQWRCVLARRSSGRTAHLDAMQRGSCSSHLVAPRRIASAPSARTLAQRPQPSAATTEPPRPPDRVWA